MDVEVIIGFMLRVFLNNNNLHGDSQMKIKLTHNHDVYNDLFHTKTSTFSTRTLILVH